MIRQGILVFEDTPQRAESVDTRVAALSLLDRNIRTMKRAGITRLLVIAPAGSDLSITSLTQRLDLHLELVTWEALQGAALFPTESFLLLLGDYAHHHSSLSQLLAADIEAKDLVVQAANPPQQDGLFFEISAATQTVSFSETETPIGPVSAGAFLCAGDLFSAAEIAHGSVNIHAFLQQKTHNHSAAVRTLEPPLWRHVSDRRSARAAKNMLFAQREGEYIEYVEEALQRIEDGTFGRCRICGGAIGRARLEAVPTATQCIECKSNVKESRAGSPQQ